MPLVDIVRYDFLYTVSFAKIPNYDTASIFHKVFIEWKVGN